MRPLLLGALLVCVFGVVATKTESGTNGEQMLPEKEGILQIDKKNFKRALRKYKQLLVHFYSPLTMEGHRVSAAFEGAAAELQGSEVKPAVIDVIKEKELAKALNVTGQPTVRLYISGDVNHPVPCPAPQSSAWILTWLKRRAGSPAELVTNLLEPEASEELTVVGVFGDLDHEYVQMFHAASIDLPNIRFAATQNEDILSRYGVKHDVILLLKNSELIQSYKMEPHTTKEELRIFISVYQMEPVTEYDGQTASQILSSPVFNHALLFVNKSSQDFEDIFSAFSRAAETFRMKILFVLVNVDETRNGRLLEYFRVRDFEAPLIRVVNLTDHVTYHLPSDTLDVESISRFCQAYLEGRAKPKLQSEPIPEGWDQQPVKELVGMNLEAVAFNPNKTVFVLFYLPYSEKSRATFPLWEELADAFKDREDVVIARLDASANDINMSVQGAYPSLCLFPALHAERVVVYTGKKNLKDLVKFMNTQMKKAQKERVKEEEDRRKYIEAMKAEEEEKLKNKDEL